MHNCNLKTENCMRQGREYEEDLMKRNLYLMEKNMSSRAFSGKLTVDLS